MPSTIDYLERYAATSFYVPSIVVYEAIEGEVKGAAPADLDAVLGHLSWAEVAPFRTETAVAAGHLREQLASRGRKLASADTMIAGTAYHLDATLVTDDADFANEDVRSILDVDEYQER